MKKILAALLVIAMIVSLAGCGVFKKALENISSKTDELSSTGEPSDEPSGGKKTDKPPKNTSKPTAEPSAEPSAEPLTPEEELRASMIGEYRFLSMGVGGEDWGGPWVTDEQHREYDRLMETTNPTVSIRDDGTGTLFFDNVSHEFTWKFDLEHVNYSKKTGLPGSYSDVLLLEGEEYPYSFGRRILTIEYAGWVCSYTSMNDEEYAEYQASFDVHDPADYELGEPFIFRAVYDTGWTVPKALIPVKNTGSEPIYLWQLDLVFRAPDGTVVWENECYGRNPAVLGPGDTGCFEVWITMNDFAEGYRDLAPSEMTIEIVGEDIRPYDIDYIHVMPLSDVELDLTTGVVTGSVTNDTGDFIIGFHNEGETWTNAHYFYEIYYVFFDKDGNIVTAMQDGDTESLEDGETHQFSAPIYWLPEGKTFRDIAGFMYWAYILGYETTEQRG